MMHFLTPLFRVYDTFFTLRTVSRVHTPLFRPSVALGRIPQARAGEARVQDELWTTQTRVDTHGRQLIQELHIARSEVPLRAVRYTFDTTVHFSSA